MKYLLQKNGDPWLDENGKKVPYECPKCGARVGVYSKGEPVFLCSGEIQHYLGTVKFPETDASSGNTLKHYGVKGMKWGVRKDRDYAGISRKASDTSRSLGEAIRAGRSRRSSSGSSRTKREAQIRAKKMSDAELKREITRLQNESNYIRLSAEAEAIRTGEGRVQRYLDNVGNGATIAAAGFSAVAGGIELYRLLHK